MKVINKNELVYKQLKTKSGEDYSLSSVISEYFGTKQVFLTHDKIAPQAQASASHRHSFIEELVFISKGQATIVSSSGEKKISEGSFIFFDPKDHEFHYLKNDTSEVVETITFSINRKDDQVIYEK